MKSFLIAGALAFAALPSVALPSQADSLIITNHDHDHDGYRHRHDHDADLHTGAIVTVHRDQPRMRSDDDCTTKTVKKYKDDKTVTKTKRVCH